MSRGLIINGVILLGVLKSELKHEAFQLDSEIAGCREKIMMLAAASPREVKDIEDNPMDWIDHCQFEVNQVLGDLELALVRRQLVEIAINSDDADVTEDLG